MSHCNTVWHLHHASKVIPQYNEANYLTAVPIATRHNVSTCHQVRYNLKYAISPALPVCCVVMINSFKFTGYVQVANMPHLNAQFGINQLLCRCQLSEPVSLPPWVQAVHWRQFVILTKFSSLAALEVVILTTSSAASDENVIKMINFRFSVAHLISFYNGTQAVANIVSNVGRWVNPNKTHRNRAETIIFHRFQSYILHKKRVNYEDKSSGIFKLLPWRPECLTCTGVIDRLPQCQWRKPDGKG